MNILSFRLSSLNLVHAKRTLTYLRDEAFIWIFYQALRCVAWYINIHCLNVDMQLYHACIIKHQNHPNPVNWNSHQARSFIVTARHIVQIWNYMFPNISKHSTQSLTQILWRKVHTFEAKSSIWSWVLTRGKLRTAKLGRIYVSKSAKQSISMSINREHRVTETQIWFG